MSADVFCKQFGPRSGTTFFRADSGSELFDTLMIFLKRSFEISNFGKKSADNKNHEKILSRQSVYRKLFKICNSFKDEMWESQGQEKLFAG